jgi:hypothetical protein
MVECVLEHMKDSWPKKKEKGGKQNGKFGETPKGKKDKKGIG